MTLSNHTIATVLTISLLVLGTAPQATDFAEVQRLDPQYSDFETFPTAEELGISEDSIKVQCDCPLSWNPVCGSDGITQPNRCFLDCENYQRRDNVQFVHYGRCEERKTELWNYTFVGWLLGNCGLYFFMNTEICLRSRFQGLDRRLHFRYLTGVGIRYPALVLVVVEGHILEWTSTGLPAPREEVCGTFRTHQFIHWLLESRYWRWPGWWYNDHQKGHGREGKRKRNNSHGCVSLANIQWRLFLQLYRSPDQFV